LLTFARALPLTVDVLKHLATSCNVAHLMISLSKTLDESNSYY
jgi:hypothetical protein